MDMAKRKIFLREKTEVVHWIELYQDHDSGVNKV